MAFKQRRNLLRGLLAAPLVLSPPSASFARPRSPEPALGSRLALPELALIEGGRFTPAEAEGRVVMVYWWASWCPFCAEMSPHVEKLWRVHRDRGLLVLGISIDNKAEAPLAYRRRRGLTFPSAMHDAKLERMLPKPNSVPVTWVRGRDGRIVMTESGQMFPEDVAEIARFL